MCTCSHKNIHKATWKSPDRNTLNQIDHILVENRFQSSIKDIRSYRGADIDTDHFLLISKFKLKLQDMKRLKERKSLKFNVDLFKNENIRKKYADSIDIHLKDSRAGNIETDWNKISLVIKETAERSIGGVQNRNKNKKKKWYNKVSREAAEKRRIARVDFIRSGNQGLKNKGKNVRIYYRGKEEVH